MEQAKATTQEIAPHFICKQFQWFALYFRFEEGTALISGDILSVFWRYSTNFAVIPDERSDDPGPIGRTCNLLADG